MGWQIIIVILIALPVILIPATLMLYLKMGNIRTAYKEFKGRRAMQEKEGQ